jgi:hypothetical protein
MQVITAPEPQEVKGPNTLTVFLAGSIEQDKAEKWQDRFTEMVKDLDHLCILNPRRKAWDATWVQEAANPQFAEQVNWELDGQELADVIVFYFDPNTKSVVTMLELGLFSSKPCIVICPEGYWRKGNVDIVCQRYGIGTASNLEAAVAQIKEMLAVSLNI